MTWVFSEKQRMDFTVLLKQHVVYQFRDHRFGMMELATSNHQFFWGQSFWMAKSQFGSFPHFREKNHALGNLTSHPTNLPHSSFQRYNPPTSQAPGAPILTFTNSIEKQGGGGLSLLKTTRTKMISLYFESTNYQVKSSQVSWVGVVMVKKIYVKSSRGPNWSNWSIFKVSGVISIFWIMVRLK